MITLERNPSLKGLTRINPQIPFSHVGGTELCMEIITPQNISGGNLPLIVFVQGSAWTHPDPYYEMTQLNRFAVEGFIVAMLRHRGIHEGNPAPAFLIDVKCGIRYLRENASVYGIDPERVYIFGTSSGANAALLAALTPDDPKYKSDEYPNQSDRVAAVAECFGPTDLNWFIEQNPDFKEPFKVFCGGKFDPVLLSEMSPVNYITPERTKIPFLILHGDADSCVPFSQSEKLVEKLEEVDADVGFVRVKGADHEGDFWSDEVLNIILDFFKKQAFPEK